MPRNKKPAKRKEKKVTGKFFRVQLEVIYDPRWKWTLAKFASVVHEKTVELEREFQRMFTKETGISK